VLSCEKDGHLGNALTTKGGKGVRNDLRKYWTSEAVKRHNNRDESTPAVGANRDPRSKKKSLLGVGTRIKQGDNDELGKT